MDTKPARPPRRSELSGLLRRWSFPTTPEELASSGATRLRRIRREYLVVLIERATRRALLEGEVDVRPDDPLRVSASAREHFLRLVGGESEKSDELEQRARDELRRLHGALAERRRELDHLSRTVPEARERELERGLYDLFVEWEGSERTLHSLRRGVSQLVLRELAAERKIARESRLREYREEIDQLERRIVKLAALLDERDVELVRLALAQAGDPGVPSIYREVQSLDRSDPHAERKSELMRSIFAANLRMREQMQRSSAEAPRRASRSPSPVGP